MNAQEHQESEEGQGTQWGCVPTANVEDPWVRYTLQAVRGGMLSSVFIILVVTLYLFLPGHHDVNRAASVALVLVATALTAMVGFLPWRRIIVHEQGKVAIYGWALVMVAIIDLAIAFTGGASSELYVVLVVMAVFLAGPAYPISLEIGLSTVMVLGYVLTLVATGWGISWADLTFRIGMMAASALAVGVLNHELGRAFQRQRAENEASENRVDLWSRMAYVARQIDAPDVDAVLDAVVGALGTLGFESSDICAIDPDGVTYRVLCARELGAEYVAGHHAVSGGIVGMVLDQRRTVVVDDYATLPGAIPALRDGGYVSVVAGPIWVNGELTAILEAGSRQRRSLLGEEVAAFEMLAAQAGHALENAHLLERQRTDASRFRQLLESAPDAVVVADASNGTIVEVSHQAESLFGYTADELVGQPATVLMPERVRSEQMSMVDHWIEGLGESVIGLDENVFALCKDGTELPVEISFSTLETPQGEVISAAIRDVSDRRAFERRLAYQATHDQLTDLPNRELFTQRLGRLLHGRLSVDPPVAVCLLDLDHFKYLNDSRGHRVGDSLVVAVSARIGRAVGSHFMARVGGDEFGLLVEGLAGPDEVLAFAERLLTSFDQPFAVDGIDCYITASIGVAFGDASDRVEVVLSNADAAVNRAKRNGRARVELFDEALTLEAAHRIATEAELHLALERGEFHLVYQPVIELDGARWMGTEALLRWDHPERGAVPPVEFIPIAEDTGLIVPIGRWVLEQSCAQLARWHHDHPELAELSISVNVSSRQLEHDQFVNDVARILRETGLPPRHVVLEITESFFIRDIQAAVRRLHALKDLGIRLAIDDFGTGFSSLFSLSRLPVDIVKIDKAFIDGLGSGYDAVVTAVVTLGVAFDLDVVAEGIETEAQRDRLVDLGCRFAQGYYFSVPLDPGSVPGLVDRGRPTAGATPTGRGW